MRDNRVKARTRAGGVVVGSSLSIPEPFVAEMIGAGNFDFLIVDMEHAPITIHQLQTMLIALSASDSTRLVRVSSNDPVAIKHVLDVGAEGVIVPDIQSREECERAVAAARYFPLGCRGFGPRRAARVGGDRADYIARSNDEVIVLAMIEHIEAVAVIDDILATPGLDGVMLGPADLAVSMGHLQHLGHPDAEAAAEEVLAACKRAGVPFGMYTVTSAKTSEWVAKGAQIVTLGSDVMFLDAGVNSAKAEAQAVVAAVS